MKDARLVDLPLRRTAPPGELTRPGCYLFAISALLLAELAACSRRESPPASTTVGTVRADGQSTAKATAERSATMPTASGASATGTRVVPLVLVAERSSLEKTWTVIAKVRSLSIQAPVTSFKEPALCGVVPFFGGAGGLPRSNVGTRQEPVSIAVNCSASAPLVGLATRDGQLVVGAATFSLPPNTHLTYPSEIQQTTVPECDGKVPEQTIDVQMVRRRAAVEGGEKGEPEMALLAAGQVLWSDAVGDVPLNCQSSRIFPKSTYVSYGCSFGESGYHLAVRSDQNRIWVDFVETGYKPTMLKQRFGTQLPCGARVRFLPLSQRDPKWKRYGSSCASECQDQWTRCEDRCYRNHADEQGTLSDAGIRCAERCRLQREDACNRVCAERGQYP